MLICLCFAVTEARIREAVAAGARDVADVGRLTAAGTDCGTCRERIARLIGELPAPGDETDGSA